MLAFNFLEVALLAVFGVVFPTFAAWVQQEPGPEVQSDPLPGVLANTVSSG